MTISQLQKIQATTQQIAEVISSVLGIDVTIFDEQMVRIAGTGHHKDTVGQKVAGYTIGQQVILYGKEYIITDVRSDRACEVCDKLPSCLELAQVCCPILLGRETLGVISMIASSREQQKRLIENKDNLLFFIRKMADLIAAKVVEKNTIYRLFFLNNQLETVLKFVAEGIIAVDAVGQIINLNYAAEKMLGVKAQEALGFHVNEIFPGTPIAEVLQSAAAFVDREVIVWRKGRQQHYLINAMPMLIEGAVQGVVASFRTAGDWRQPETGKRQTSVSFDDIIGVSVALETAKDEARKAAQGRTTILLTGESGTGKEVFARAIHAESERSNGPFIAVNCAAIPENLLESELFGYEEGSFTGARKGGKPGKFLLADGGTLFLDEIGDMPPVLQAKMLRVLQDRVVERVGGVKTFVVNARIITATNRNLEDMVRTGHFREDLYYRLHVFPIHLPALRDRQDDIALLAEHFLRKHALLNDRPSLEIAPDAAAVLHRYSWPGNIRELENTIEYAVIKHGGPKLERAHLPAKMFAVGGAGANANGAQGGVRGGDPEKENLIKALAAFDANVTGKSQAAASLGISRATLYRKLRKHDLLKVQ
jgi:sigma-54 dependent transcriptional regulator, acetoin dehydrogenase operon transcriptional activator AcoR